MDTKIKDTFWKDPAIEKLIEAEDRDAVFSILWLMTSQVNAAGWVEVTPRYFRFQTSCELEDLRRGCEALGKGIVTHEKGFWIRNFIRHQIGVGESMASNNMAGSVIKTFNTMPPEIVAEVLLQYPELKDRLTAHKSKQTRSSSQGLDKGCISTGEEKRREEKRGEEGNGSAEGRGPITLADALAFAKRWCESSPSMIAFDAVQVELWFTDRERKQWQASSGQVIGSQKQAEKDLSFWLLKAKTGQPPPRPGSEKGGNPAFEKKGGGGPGASAHPLAVPPCVEWKKIYRALVEAAEAADSDWVAWWERANWDDVPSSDRQAIVDEVKRTNGGGAGL